MKRLVRLVSVFSLLLGCWGWLGTSQIAQAANFNSVAFQSVPVLAVEDIQQLRNPADERLAEVYGKRIDLNNTNVRAFQKYPGLYPNLARKIIAHAPYKKAEDVMDLEGLTKHQKQILEANLDHFTVSQRASVFNEGDDRINNGIYR